MRLAQALIWLAALSSPLEAGPAAVGKWTPLESLKYRLVNYVQVSPDGKTAAYVVRDSILEPDKSEYRTQIWLSTTQADGKRSWQATSGPSSASKPISNSAA